MKHWAILVTLGLVCEVDLTFKTKAPWQIFDWNFSAE